MTSTDAVVTLPPWSRKTVYALSGTVGACALLASGFELYSLARNAGFAMGVAAALPIGLDAGAAGAAVLWVVGAHGSPLRRQGKVTTLVLVAVSAVCNGVSVLAVPMRTVVGQEAQAQVSVGFVTFVAFLLAFVFPLVAARSVHLLLSVRDVATREQPARVRVPLVPARVPVSVASERDPVDPDMPAIAPAAEPAASAAPVDTATPPHGVETPAEPAPNPAPEPRRNLPVDEQPMRVLRAMPVATAGPNAGVLPPRAEARKQLGRGWDETDRLLTRLRTERATPP